MTRLEDLIRNDVPSFKWAAFNFKIINGVVSDFSMESLFDTFGYEVSNDELRYTGDDEWLWQKNQNGQLTRSLSSNFSEEIDPYIFLSNLINSNKHLLFDQFKNLHIFKISNQTNFKCLGVIYIIYSAPKAQVDFFDKYGIDFMRFSGYPCTTKALDQWIQHEMRPLNDARTIRIEAVKQKCLLKQEDGKLVLGENSKNEEFICEVEDCEGNLITFSPDPNFKGILIRFVLNEPIFNTLKVE